MLKNKIQLIQILLAKVERYHGQPNDRNFLSVQRTAEIIYEVGWAEGYTLGEIEGIKGALDIENEIKTI